MILHEINREIKFVTHKPSSPYRCTYRDKRFFDILRINCKYNGVVKEVYEIESKYLPDKDSISFKAEPEGDSFKVVKWSPQTIIGYIKRVK